MRRACRAAAIASVASAYAAHRIAESRRVAHEPRTYDDGGIDQPRSDAAIDAVAERGYAVTRSLVPPKELESIKKTDAFRSMPSDSAEPGSDEWRLSAPGRYHRIHFSDNDVEVFSIVERRLAPYVARFFGLAEEDVLSNHEIYRSELQLLNAAPKLHEWHPDTKSQIWHSDHRAKGLTLVVPLVDFSPSNGGTQLLPGSHALSTAWPALMGGARVATVPAGGLLAYDARTYHRGLSNLTEHSRPALVFRYDRRDERPPPGVGLVGSLLHASAATALHAMTAMVSAARGEAG